MYDSIILENNGLLGKIAVIGTIIIGTLGIAPLSVPDRTTGALHKKCWKIKCIMVRTIRTVTIKCFK